MKPIAQRVSQWNSRTEIIYGCGNCGVSFAILGRNEKYCHNCGRKADYRGIPSHCSVTFSKLYHDCNNPNIQRRMLRHYVAVWKEGKEKHDES